MSRRTTLTITMALAVALVGGAGAARAADEATTGEAISTVQEIDAEQHLLVLTGGLHLLATDPSVLAQLYKGETVKVAFTEEGGRLFIDRVEAMDQPSLYDQMHVGEGETTGARPIQHPAGPGSETFSASPRTAGDPGAYDGAPEPEAP